MNKQTNRQTKKLNVLATPAVGEIRTWHCTVIEDLEHILAPRKRFRVRRIVSPLGGAQNLGGTRLPQLNPLTQ